MQQIVFEKLVQKALSKLPEGIRKRMENVAICIEEEPSPWQMMKSGTRIFNSLLGIYQGVPKTVWGRESSPGRIPDKITIFQRPIEELGRSEEEIEEIVRVVVWHEIAHHFGFSEHKVRELERKWRRV